MDTPSSPASAPSPMPVSVPVSVPVSSAWQLWPGLCLAAALAAVSMALGQWDQLASRGIGPLTLALVAGLVIGHSLPAQMSAAAVPGIELARQRLLRWGIVLYGFRLTVQDVMQIGGQGVLLDAAVIASTFAIACVVGLRVLRMDPQTTMLVGAGASICGAAAVMATAPVVRGRPEQVTVAVATVVVFGTLAMGLYPVLWPLAREAGLLPGGSRGFGIYIGSTVHEVAQVVAAARAVDAQAADAAIITKMVRVLMLAPFLLALSVFLSKGGAVSGEAGLAGVSRAVPWFAFGFVGVVLFNSLGLVAAGAVAAISTLDTALLATAMAALGLSTHVSALRRAGPRPMLLALVLFVWLVAGGAWLNRLFFV